MSNKYLISVQHINWFTDNYDMPVNWIISQLLEGKTVITTKKELIFPWEKVSYKLKPCGDRFYAFRIRG